MTPPDDHAGGWPALTNGLRALNREDALLSGGKALLRMNQPDGFDCPGCAWPDPKDASAFEFCENGIKALAAEATTRAVTADHLARNPVSALRTQTDRQLESHGRLVTPVRYNRDLDVLEPIAWQDAFNVIGNHLRSLRDPNRAIFYTSGRTSNEAAFLYQLLGRKLGTNNFPDCSNMCHESSGTAMTESVGIGKGTVTLDDFDETELIFVIGQNPGTNHPRMLIELQKAAQRGAKIVAVNPLKERALCKFLHPQHAGAMLSNESTAIATHYLQPLIGGDMALLKGIMKRLLQLEADQPNTIIDHDFIKAHTTGYDDFVASLETVSWARIEEESGVKRSAIEEIGDLYATAKSAIVCWAMGLTQHVHAVATIQDTINLLLLRGNLGKPGAGACPVRGHSNVQGDRTVGITERPKQPFLDRLGKHFGFLAPAAHGLDVVAAIDAMQAGKAEVFIAMGGNFVRATPDSAYSLEAMSKCKLTVHVATKLNHTHLVDSEEVIILPCLGRSEIDQGPNGARAVSVEDSMSMVHLSAGKRRPPSADLRSEPDIVAGIAEATFPNDTIDWQGLSSDYDRIRDAIEAVIPSFENFNRRVRQPGGFHLRNSARERDWATSSGKAAFITSALPTLGLPENQLRLMTLRSHDQYNTTVYTDNDRYRGIYGNRLVIFLNETDAKARGLADGDIVKVTTEATDRPRSLSGVRVVIYDIPENCAAMYFPEANVLVPAKRFAKKSRTPASKFIPVIITPTP